MTLWADLPFVVYGIFSISPIVLKLKIPYTDRRVIILHPSGHACTRSIQCMVDVHIHGHIQSVGAVLKTCCRSTGGLLPFLLNDKEGEKLSAGYRSMPGTTPRKRNKLDLSSTTLFLCYH